MLILFLNTEQVKNRTLLFLLKAIFKVLLFQGDSASSAVVISRKRKAWEGTGRTVSNKYVGSGRLPNNRDPDDEDDKGDDHDGIIIAKGDGLDTPVCSRTGFEVGCLPPVWGSGQDFCDSFVFLYYCLLYHTRFILSFIPFKEKEIDF